MPTLHPLLLRGDAVTSPQRTPWGGTRLAKHFDKGADPNARIGESWELSLGDELPSTVRGSNERLTRVIAANPKGWLGRDPGRSQSLLVKMLDADAPLSVQIHPHNDDPTLASNESGKPESWYVIATEPKAWIAFGWNAGVTRADVEHALGRGDGSLAKLLQRVYVEVGDTFIVDAGTPHAIGPGVTLIEPQYVADAKRGLTYRYWDWDRLYDGRGLESSAGSKRALHVEDALRVTNWTRGGEDLLRAAFRRDGVPDLVEPLTHRLIAGADAPPGSGVLVSEFLRMERFTGTGTLAIPPVEMLQAWTVAGGEGEVRGPEGEVLAAFRRGQTFAFPASLAHAGGTLHGEALHILRSSIEPA